MITDMQKEVFEEQGIDGNHGVEFLGQINTVYKTDDAILAELLKFASLYVNPCSPSPTVMLPST